MALPSNGDLPNYPFPAVARTYDFEFLRMMMQMFLGYNGPAEGIAGASTDFAVSIGSGLQLNAAAGRAFVKGDTRSTQGSYFVYNPATESVTLDAHNATLPRVDRVVLRVYDADATGVSTKWDVEKVSGTPTSGATLSNLNGAASVPDGCLLLANALVPATSGAVTLDDRRAMIGAGLGVSRGASIIATEEVVTSTSYAAAATPDRVRSITLPSPGLICIAAVGMAKESVDGAARIAIHLNGTQVKIQSAGSAAPLVAEAGIPGGAGVYVPFTTSPIQGISGVAGNTVTAFTGHVGTGQILGDLNTAQFGYGPIYVFADAGTYDIDIRYKSTSGTVTVKERKLWVWSMGF